jgi:glucose-1-phosphate thymidylyltransferase
VTKVISKQLLPLYDKPMIYYSIATLMQIGIREILIVTSPEEVERYRQLLGDGSQWGIVVQYCVQPRPEGIAQALILGRDFCAGGPVTLILGDNFIHGDRLTHAFGTAARLTEGAINFAYRVSDPERYGIVEFDAHGRPSRLVEKPAKPKSPWAIIGLYIYDTQAAEIAASLKPSGRGELEITDVNQRYLDRGELRVEKLGPGHAWLDTGTYDSWLEACHYVQTIFHRQGIMIGCPEEIAYRSGYITAAQLEAQAATMSSSPYGAYLKRLLASDL